MSAQPRNALAFVVLSIVAMLVVPLPPALLDLLLALDVMGAAALLVVSLSVRDPLDLSAFPALLLVATLFRLGLDVSATRLILTQGSVPGGVGSVIPAFGDFVMRGNPVVGLLLFVILVVVQLVVVTNGAQRVAEVAARFTLDSMPGKQMAIDADLHAGAIDATTARARRRALQAESDFYGAMDGAGKFVRGDAVAAMVIVAVNLVAGFGIGVVADHLDPVSAAQTFALLSIGNALATTLPAFLLSTAMGIMVTRAASDAGLGGDLARQLLANPSALRAVSAAMVGLAVVPGLPHGAFGALGIAGFVFASAAGKNDAKRKHTRAQEEARRRAVQARQPEQAVALLGVDALSIDLGLELTSLLDEPSASTLLARIATVRQRLALELGVVVPSVRVRDDLRLEPRAFAIRVRDRVVMRGEVHPQRPLAVGTPAALSQLRGDPATDPVTGMPARVVTDPLGLLPDGAIVVDPIAVLGSALLAVARDHAATLLARQDVQNIVDHVRKMQPAAVKGVVPEIAGLGLVQRVLAHLVREGVSVRDVVGIIETIADEAERTKDAAAIGEAARRRLSPSICASVADADGRIRAVIPTPACEERLTGALVSDDRGPALALEMDDVGTLAKRLEDISRRKAGRVVIACGQAVRLALSRFAASCGVKATVVGFAEVAAGYSLVPEETFDFEDD